MIKLTQMQIDKFRSNIFTPNEYGCMLWTGPKCTGGYGNHYTMSGTQRAHRIAVQLSSGEEIPSGMFVLHSCDTPACVNPAHLSIGDHARNMRERSERGRVRKSFGNKNGARVHPERLPRGERNGMATLSDEQYTEIRSMYGTSMCPKKIASMYGVSLSFIYVIWQGKTGRVINPEKPYINHIEHSRKTSSGVTWNKRAMKWQAQYIKNGKTIYLGVFHDRDDAIKTSADARYKQQMNNEQGNK